MFTKFSRKDSAVVYVSKVVQRRRLSCWRYWNRLSSLQRSIVCMMAIFGTLSAMYIIPTIYHDYSNLENQAVVEAQSHNEMPAVTAPHAAANMDAYIQREIDAIRQKASAARNLTKRGPPKRGSQFGKVKFSGPQNPRQEAVVAAFRHSWQAYKQYAWGRDELLPLTKSYSEWFGLGLTLVDSLDTMYIMGLNDEFRLAREWVAQNMSFNSGRDVNLFECTIRILGGLLSAYHLSNDKLFLDKAQDLGNRLMPAFKTGSGVPYSDVNLRDLTAHAPRWGPDSSTSEVTTIQLEFTDLSRQTGDPKYEAAMAVTHHVHSLYKKDGLVPIFINAHSGVFRPAATITFGARGDSYYEYLFKMWLQRGQTDSVLKDDFIDAMEGMKRHLVSTSQPNKLFYIGELLAGHSFSPKMDHLVCYLGGVLALAASNGFSESYFEMGKNLTATCYEMYRRMPTGLSPEIAYFNSAPESKEDLIVKPADSHNLQRPETVESLMYLYRLTGNSMYQDWGWTIFEAFEKYTKLPVGYSSIGNVQSPASPQYRNKMESFWLAETLKYFYLLFDDSKELLPLDKFVFNTEAHPLPVYR